MISIKPIPFISIPEHTPSLNCEWLHNGQCYWCCEKCNYVEHTCHFCGENLNHNSFEFNGNRHYLSDCRPDLVDGSYDGTKYANEKMVP